MLADLASILLHRFVKGIAIAKNIATADGMGFVKGIAIARNIATVDGMGFVMDIAIAKNITTVDGMGIVKGIAIGGTWTKSVWRDAKRTRAMNGPVVTVP